MLDEACVLPCTSLLQGTMLLVQNPPRTRPERLEAATTRRHQEAVPDSADPDQRQPGPDPEFRLLIGDVGRTSAVPAAPRRRTRARGGVCRCNGPRRNPGAEWSVQVVLPLPKQRPSPLGVRSIYI